MPSLAEFCGGTSAAIFIKLTSSIDDVLWLSAFLIPSLSPRQRVQNAITYGCVCLLQTLLAYFISTFGEEAVETMLQKQGINMSTDRILTLIAGAILLVYSIVLGVGYYKENYYGEDCEKGEYDAIELLEGEEGGEGGAMPGAGPSSGETTAEDIETPVDKEQKESITEDDGPSPRLQSDKKSGSLALIAFIGSLDDLTLFVPLLVGKTFGIFELITGAMIATLAILVICLFVSKCQLMANVLERIPLVAIVVGFTMFLLAKGIFFMD